MDNTTITSADAVFSIVAPGIFPTPVQLSGYSADKAWSTDNQDQAEVQMGVDGRQTAGFTPTPVVQNISLQADSPSKFIFNAIAAYQRTKRTIVYLTGDIAIPGTGENFICYRGVLKTVKPLPDASKVLQPMDFTIQWESIKPASL